MCSEGNGGPRGRHRLSGQAKGMDHLHVQGQEKNRVPKAVDPFEPAPQCPASCKLSTSSPHHKITSKFFHLGVGAEAARGPGASTICPQPAALETGAYLKGPRWCPAHGVGRNPKGHAYQPLANSCTLHRYVCNFLLWVSLVLEYGSKLFPRAKL